MLELPSSTAFNRRIPKQKFYDNLSVTPELKRVFIDQISVIYWRNKLATSTLNVGPGEVVTELEVFELRLNLPELNTGILQLIDREIPYHILFLLTYEDKVQAWIGYKEAAQNKQVAFKVSAYYHTEWLPLEELPLKLTGLTMDAVYEHFVRQIAGERFVTSSQATGGKGISLQEAVERDEKRQALEKQIASLQKKVNAEKQFNRRIELNLLLGKYITELQGLVGRR